MNVEIATFFVNVLVSVATVSSKGGSTDHPKGESCCPNKSRTAVPQRFPGDVCRGRRHCSRPTYALAVRELGPQTFDRGTATV